MPMIDVYAASDLLPEDTHRPLGEALVSAVLRAEGVSSPGRFHLDNTAAFLHLLPANSVQTGSSAAARTVRVQIITPPSALTRDGQKKLTKEITEIIANLTGDSSQPQRTWVILTEAAEGGWGIAGTAFGKEEFAALAQTATKAI